MNLIGKAIGNKSRSAAAQLSRRSCALFPTPATKRTTLDFGPRWFVRLWHLADIPTVAAKCPLSGLERTWREHTECLLVRSKL